MILFKDIIPFLLNNMKSFGLLAISALDFKTGVESLACTRLITASQRSGGKVMFSFVCLSVCLFTGVGGGVWSMYRASALPPVETEPQPHNMLNLNFTVQGTLDMFILVHKGARTVGKRAVGIRLNLSSWSSYFISDCKTCQHLGSQCGSRCIFQLTLQTDIRHWHWVSITIGF